MIRRLLPFLLIAIVSMAVTAWLTDGIENVVLLLIVRIGLAAALYLGLVWLTGAKILRESIQFIRHHGKQQTT